MSLIAGAISLCSLAQNVDRVGISGVAIEKTDNGVLIVSMQVNPSQTSVKYNQQLVITPVIPSQEKMLITIRSGMTISRARLSCVQAKKRNTAIPSPYPLKTG